MVLPLSFVKKTVYVKIKDVAALLMEARGPATDVMANWRKAGRTGRFQASTPRVYTIAKRGESTSYDHKSLIIEKIWGNCMRVRRSARLILLDEEHRVLLFKVEDASVFRPDRPLPTVFWITPGGGVEDGETDEDAARRELWEETGIVEFELGPLVAVGEPVLNVAGEMVKALDQYYLIHLSAPVVYIDNMVQLERDVYRDHRWWTVDELCTTDELIFPLDLADLLVRIISNDLPPQAIHLVE